MFERNGIKAKGLFKNLNFYPIKLKLSLIFYTAFLSVYFILNYHHIQWAMILYLLNIFCSFFFSFNMSLLHASGSRQLHGSEV